MGFGSGRCIRAAQLRCERKREREREREFEINLVD